MGRGALLIVPDHRHTGGGNGEAADCIQKLGTLATGQRLFCAQRKSLLVHNRQGIHCPIGSGILTEGGHHFLLYLEFAWACLGNATDEKEANTLFLMAYNWNLSVEEVREKLNQDLSKE